MTIYVAPPSAMDDAIFGYGVNLLTGQRVGQSCVTGLPAAAAATPADSGDTMHALVVEDSESFSQLMSTVTSISASGLSWSASASVSYLREQANDDTAITFTWTRVIRSVDRIADYTKATIDSTALGVLKTQGMDAFVAAYGTHCMIGIAYGGSFSGYAQLKTDSVTQKEQLMADISGSISGFGVSGSVSEDFQQQLSSSSVHHSSSQDTTVVGAAPIHFSGMDIAAMQTALEGFTLSKNDSGVDGAPVAVICVTWDQFADIVAALGEQKAAGYFQYSAQQSTLSALSAEYSALSYVSGTAAGLAPSGTIVPAYLSAVEKIGQHADSARALISALDMATVTRLSANGYGAYILSPTLAPTLGWVGRGLAMVQLSYALDWAFGSPSSSTTFSATPGGSEQSVGSWTHVRPEGDDPPQQMSLYYTIGRDSGGTPNFSVRMHWHDPYGPPNDADYTSNTVSLTPGSENGSGLISASAAWTPWPASWISITLVMPSS